MYLVRDIVEDEQRALKLFNTAHGFEAARREIGALRKIDHPNVVKVFSAGRTGMPLNSTELSVAGFKLRLQFSRVFLAIVVIGVADIGGQGEAGRDFDAGEEGLVVFPRVLSEREGAQGEERPKVSFHVLL